MGVTYLQHRIVTGSFATCNENCYCSTGKRINGKCNSYDLKNEFKMIMCSIFSITYMYIILLLMAGAINTACDIKVTKLHRSYDIGSSVLNCWAGTLNTAIL